MVSETKSAMTKRRIAIAIRAVGLRIIVQHKSTVTGQRLPSLNQSLDKPVGELRDRTRSVEYSESDNSLYPMMEISTEKNKYM